LQLSPRFVADTDDADVFHGGSRVQFRLDGSADGAVDGAAQASVGGQGDQQLLLRLLGYLPILAHLSMLKLKKRLSEKC